MKCDKCSKHKGQPNSWGQDLSTSRRDDAGVTHPHDCMFEANGSEVEVHPDAPCLTEHMNQQRLVEHPACINKPSHYSVMARNACIYCKSTHQLEILTTLDRPGHTQSYLFSTHMYKVRHDKE